QIQSLLDQFSGLVVVDEAYIDFSDGGTAIHFLDEYPRLIICQTFSKAYGLAGIRLGIGFAHPTIIEFFNKIKLPYNVNVLTQKKALAALNVTDVVERQVRALIGERQKMEEELLTIGFVKKIYPSDANFLLVLVDDAQKRYNQFLEQGIVVRSRSSLLGCENTLRITVGTPQENITFINACKTIDQ
ncbi:MAG: pyridoxal phosphate-dependent aminotransferase, partial [Flavobacteriaceae bacterium]